MKDYNKGMLTQKKSLFRKYSASTILVFSFLLVILAGTLLLSLPFANHGNVTLLDNLFTSTTATCVTGLMTTCAKESYTIFGQAVILIMIQIGGLGLMSFVALFMVFLKDKLDLSSRGIIKNALNKDDYSGISDYLKNIIKYSFLIEFIAFILMVPELFDGSFYSIFQAFFLAISAFCNAGIDILGNNSLINYVSNPTINIVITLEIILGGLGFMVWFDFINNLKLLLRLKVNFKNFIYKLKPHTKIVLIMTIILNLAGTLLILFFEFNSSLDNLSFIDKLQAAYFNSITLRTAGFATIDYSRIKEPTKLLMCVFMLIGASPGGTGGGLKTTTVFLVGLGIINVLRNVKHIHFFNKHISKENVMNAFSILTLYTFISILALLILSCFEEYHVIDLLFEVTSALGTVGLTVGITSHLSIISKLVIIVLMFIGRLGPITISLSLMKQNKANDIKYPNTEIMVG